MVKGLLGRQSHHGAAFYVAYYMEYRRFDLAHLWINKAETLLANAAGTAISGAATLTVNEAAVSVTSVSVFPTTLSLAVGRSSQLKATISPSDATNQSVSWASGNTNVAVVDGNGVVRAVGTGPTEITAATADGGYTSKCAVTVRKAGGGKPAAGKEPGSVTGVTLNKIAFALKVGGKAFLVATITPPDAAHQNVVWTTSNSKVVEVNQNGQITAVGTGTAVIPPPAPLR